jgi:transposase-like protein/DNA-directed RNA polymerase subunit RPC12/RpoP
MERDWLARELEAGRSIEDIAREVGRDPSTVAHWVNRHGLRSVHAPRHAPRGAISRDGLETLIGFGMSIRQIARELDRSPATIRHWMRRYGLRTQAAQRVRRDGSTAPEVMRDCPRHGWTWFRRVGAQTHYRCARCVVEAVTDRRRTIKEILVDEAGGRCAACGYATCRAALQFHHVDPTIKAFDVAGRGVTRSLERARAEARKCVLLCANCHAEVEAGARSLALTSSAADPVSILGGTVGPG